jgi:hypothetical protein
MQSLVEAVQRNCDIVDARHGSEFGMCTYLLKMREMYRWQQGLPLGAALDRQAVGDWLSEREAQLESLENADFAPLTIDGETLDPFDADRLNAVLGPHGLVYSAGLVQGARPHFFLAELEAEERAEQGFVLRVSGRELARGLNAPPAMTRGTQIFLRREALRRYLWEKYESWLWSRPDNAMARAVACYPFDSALDEALDRMTSAEMTVVEAHERGEYQAGLALGEAWDVMLLDLESTPAELMARAVRDHLADCSQTLPMLVERRLEASLHFFIANLGAMRKHLFPGLHGGYADWLGAGDWGVLERLARHGASHWQAVAGQMLEIHGRHGPAAAAHIASAVESSRLGG